MIKKLSFLLLIAVVGVLSATAQIINPVTWDSSVKMTGDKSGEVIFSATIDAGWHIYGLTTPEGSGIQPTEVIWDKLEGVELVGELTPSRPAHEEMDVVMNMKLGWWEKDITLVQKFDVTGDSYKISGNVKFMVCSANTCQPPTKEPFEFTSGTSSAESGKASAGEVNASPAVAVSGSELWAPVDFSSVEVKENEASIDGLSSWLIFLGGFVGGLLALLTPCVWPMIPLTVSFFLKKSGSRRKSITNAILYGLSIIVIYLILGLAVTMIFGASALNALSTNAVCNIIFFLMLVVFAISFFGAFDIKLPDSWANKMDSKAEKTTGLLSIFFMAFTLTLVSFSCTGPIIGTLLVEAANLGNYTGPAVGMFGFALALAIPFTMFAIFPSWLKEVPKSGGWMNTVKVTLGFIELALSLKFLSVADLAYGWHILDREVFVSLWVVIFALLGLYLLGKIRFAHDEPVEYVSVPRLALVIAVFSFVVYLIPGMWGAPLKALSGYMPPITTQDFVLGQNTGSAHNVEAAPTISSEFGLHLPLGLHGYFDLEDALQAAKEAGKPVFVDVTGHGCVNCREM